MEGRERGSGNGHRLTVIISTYASLNHDVNLSVFRSYGYLNRIKRHLNRIKMALDTVGMKANPEKTEIVVLNARFDCVRNMVFEFDGTNISPRENARYLGVFFSSTRRWCTHKSVILARSKRALYQCVKAVKDLGRANFRRDLEIFDAMVMSICMFAMPIWGLETSMFDFDKMCAIFYRTVLGVTTQTRKMIMLAELAEPCCTCFLLYHSCLFYARTSTGCPEYVSDLMHAERDGAMSWRDLLRSQVGLMKTNKLRMCSSVR